MTGGASSGRKGSRYERELVSRLREHGYGALRLPASGSATDRELPDVLAGTPKQATADIGYDEPATIDFNASQLWAIEAKSGDATTLYVNGAEVAALRSFAETWGAAPFLAARFTTQASGTGHYLVRPDDARRSDSGNYGLPIADIDERASVIVGEHGVTRE